MARTMKRGKWLELPGIKRIELRGQRLHALLRGSHFVGLEQRGGTLGGFLERFKGSSL
jgi:hypothetical protein